MRIQICAVGRLRAGPEKTLIDDYLTRFDRTGRALGLGPVELREIDERKAQTKAAVAGSAIENLKRICAMGPNSDVRKNISHKSRKMGWQR